MSPIGSSAAVSSPSRACRRRASSGAASVDADDREAARDRGSSRRSRGRSAAAFAAGRRARARPSRSSFASFLASRDRVKGRGQRSSGSRRQRRYVSPDSSTCSSRHAAPFGTSLGSPRSGKGISIRSKSRGATVGSKTSRPPRAPRRRGSGRRCGRAASIFTSASRATAAAWPTVEWPVSSGALGLLLGEAGVVDEQLGAAGGLDGRLAGAGVAGDRDRPARAGLPHHLLGPDAARRAVDRLAPLQGGEGGAFGHAEPLRRLEVEAAGPLVLDQGVAAGADAVLDLEGADLGALELDHVARARARPGRAGSRSARSAGPAS